MNDSIKILDKGDVAVIEFDLVGEKVNKLSTPVMQRLKEVVDELKSSKYKAAILISRKKNIFIAGADIEEIKAMKKKEDFMAALDQAHEIFNSLEDLPIPTIAAINGACLGGGLELSMACDYRIATSDASTKIGLPEIKLGIIPGFGGCVRMPRIIGLQAALDIILAGKAVDSRKALKIGLIDSAVPAEQLEQRAMEFAKEIVSGKKGKRKKKFKPKSMQDKILESALGRKIVFSQAKKSVMKLTKGFYPAPLAALEVIKKSYGIKRDKAIKIEAEGFCSVAVSDVSKHLINLFFMMESIKKQSGVSNADVKAHKVDHMGVLGAGVMGGGIAYVGADKNIDVRMKDISNDAVANGFKHARELWEKKLNRRRLDKYAFEQKMSHVSGTLDFSGFQNMDVVVEAIVEDMNIKKAVISETVKHLGNDCIFATNTSSLSVTEMAEAHPHPEKFVGMHFFNPVDKMPLVEVIRGKHTSDEAVATIFELSKKMGKTPVVVKDGPGFLVNRLLLPLLSEAMFLLEEGVEIGEVDRYYTHQFGMPMGPFRLMDEVGLDVCTKVLKIFRKSLGDRIEVSKLTDKFAECGRLGRKNKKGFYQYDEKGRAGDVDETVYADLGLGKPKGGLSSKECIERGIFQMINEASRALKEDHICETAQECDLAMIMGTGFPPFRGGLLKYADTLGADYIVQQLEEYSQRLGVRFKPSQSLTAMVNGGTFY